MHNAWQLLRRTILIGWVLLFIPAKQTFLRLLVALLVSVFSLTILLAVRPYARAEDNLDHPALASLKGTYLAGELTDRDWVCGTPTVLNAVRKMVDLRQQVEARK